MSETPNFAARLQQLRTAAKMTQRELAERSGLHRVAIANLERGERHPTWETVLLLARALGIGVELFADESLPLPENAPPPERGRPPRAAPARKPRKRKES
jgi:transcriptional regulator with XRE-family HTH domain